MTTARLTSVRLDESRIEVLSALAELNQTSIAEEIRTAVTMYIKGQDGSSLQQALELKHREERERLARVLEVSTL